MAYLFFPFFSCVLGRYRITAYFIMTLTKASEIKKRLDESPDYVAVVHNQKAGLELQFVYGIPGARICVLYSVEPDNVLILSRDKYNQFQRMEGDIIADANAASGRSESGEGN